MNVTDWMMALMIVEGSILFSVVILLLYIRHAVRQLGEKRMGPLRPGELKEWVRESRTICETFSKNLQEKREIAKGLIRQLDGKIQGFNQSLNSLEARENSRIKDLHPRILEMAEEGCDALHIARCLRISKGEVQLILDLERYSHSLPSSPAPDPAVERRVEDRSGSLMNKVPLKDGRAEGLT